MSVFDDGDQSGSHAGTRHKDNWPRQLQPVIVKICGGEAIDRSYWAGRIKAFLENQPCVTNHYPTTQPIEAFTIYPDANND